MPVEAVSIAKLQRSSWRENETMSPMLAALDEQAMIESWHQAIVRPPLAHFRVLVATEPVGPTEPHGAQGQRQQQTIKGFAAIGPGGDPDVAPTDAEVAEFCVPASRDATGEHADRLLNAVVDTMRADGYRRALWWIASTDDGLRSWLVSAGWDADGAHREIGDQDGSVALRQIRLHTSIAD